MSLAPKQSNKSPFVGLFLPYVRPSIGFFTPYIGRPTHSCGVTLIELVITLSIAAVLIGVAVPAMSTFIQSNRLSGFTNAFLGSLALARSEALKRSASVGVCPSTAGASCDGTTWAAGWMVFADNNGNGTVDNNDTVLRVNEAAGSNIIVTAPTSTLFYNAQGRASPGAVYTICNNRIARSREVTVTATGHHRVAESAC